MAQSQKKSNSSISHSLKNEVSSKKKNDFKSEESKRNNENSLKYNLKELVNTANKYFLIEILSPELKYNEERKREHKDKLIDIMKYFLLFQFILLSFLLLGVISVVFVFHGLKNDIDLNYLKTIINFISIYITSVVVEIIAMLNYIVSNVFDTSITGLVEMYKEGIADAKNEIDIDGKE